MSDTDLAAALALPRVVALQTVGSTLDVAHELAAAAAAAGTLVLAEEQTAGRGRMGRSWRSAPGAGIWLTIVERPTDPAALEVLSLRLGLALAPRLDVFVEERVGLKWPNDLYLSRRKLAGVLVEVRWRGGTPDWVAIGVGINASAPEGEPNAAGLAPGTSRRAVLHSIVPAIRAAAAHTGSLTAPELDAFARRDVAIGRRCIEPVAGVVRGIDAGGALRVEVASGVITVRAGSLILEDHRA